MLSGKSRVLFGVLLLFAVLLAVFYWEKTVSYTLLYALILMLAGALVQAAAAPRWLRVVREHDVYVLDKGDKLVYRLKLSARGPLPYLNVSLRHGDVPSVHLEDRLIPELQAKSRLVGYALRFPYRGVYPLELDTVSVSDYLGLFRRAFTPELGGAAQIIVLPRIIPGFTLPLDRQARERLSPRRNFIREVRTEPGDLRQYMPGDDYRKVHWKLTAKYGDMVVKQPPSTEPEKLRLFLDTRPAPGEANVRLATEDALVSLAASAAKFCRSRGENTLLLWDGGRGRMELSAGDDLTALSRMLAGLVFDGDEEGFPQFCQGLAGEDATFDLVVFLCVLDNPAYDAMASLVRQGHRLVLYVAGVEMDGDTAGHVRALEELGASVLPFAVELEEVEEA